MSEARTAGSAALTEIVASSTWTRPPDPEPVSTLGLFEARVLRSNQLVLIPKTALAASLLGMWLHGDTKKSSTLISGGPGETWAYGNRLRSLLGKGEA